MATTTSSSQSPSQALVERASKAGRTYIIGYMFLFALSQYAAVFADISHSSRGVSSAARLVSTIAGLGGLVLMLCHAPLGSRVRADAKAYAALQDERSRLVRLRALAAGFFVVTGALAILGIVTVRYPVVDGHAVVRLALATGCFAFALAYVRYDGEA